MTGSFLPTIVGEVREEIRRGTYALAAPPPPSFGARPSLRAAVIAHAKEGALLVEFKRASPGRKEPSLPARSIPEFLKLTATAPVAGYSCLATRPRFDGSPRLVAELAAATNRPVLFKDFVVDPVQLEAAKSAGASAVLLIARLSTERLLEHPLPELAERAHRLGLEVLLEFHASEELDLADGVRPDLVGVNVRDLGTLELERSRAHRTIREAQDRGLGPLLGLSGVEGPREAEEFWKAGCDGLLVGSAVALARDPAAFLRSLSRARSPP